MYRKVYTSKETYIQWYVYVKSATHCNTPQHAATHCNTLQWVRQVYTSKETYIQRQVYVKSATRCTTLQHAATRCNTLQHAAVDASSTYFKRDLHSEICVCQKRSKYWDIDISRNRYVYVKSATRCNTLQHTATHTHTHTQKRSKYWDIDISSNRYMYVDSATRCNTLQHTHTHTKEIYVLRHRHIEQQSSQASHVTCHVNEWVTNLQHTQIIDISSNSQVKRVMSHVTWMNESRTYNIRRS